jgi:PAS domain S-box-containing protein
VSGTKGKRGDHRQPQLGETIRNRKTLKQNYRVYFNQASDAILISEPKTGRIIEGNRRAALLTGYSLGELRRLPISNLIDPKQRDRLQRFFKTLITGKKVPMASFPSLRKDGSRGSVEISACLIKDGDHRVVQAIVRDVTERQAAELEKTQMLEKIQASYRELLRTEAQRVHSGKMASLEQLVAGVAHELNNPIGFLNSNLEHLLGFIGDLRQMFHYYDRLLKHDYKKQQLAEKRKEEVELPFILDTMEKLANSCRFGALRAKEIVENLRTFSRMDEAAVKEADIHENLEITLSLLGNEIRDRIAVHREYGDIPLLECNIGQLNQVLMNLIMNACQAIPDRGDLWIRTRVKDEALTVSIRDNGVGIPKGQLSRIFDPFFTTKEPGQGTGLGLAIAFGVVKEHGGNIEVQSQVGKGSTFTVKIPIKRQLVWETDF